MKKIFLSASVFWIVACASAPKKPIDLSENQPIQEAPAIEKSEEENLNSKDSSANENLEKKSEEIAFKTSPDSLTQKNLSDTSFFDPNLPPIPEQSDTSMIQTAPPDPYVEIQKIAAEVFSHANQLMNSGKADSARFYLERFIVLNPLWGSWMKQAENLQARAKNLEREHTEAFRPLALLIVNENATGGDFGKVRALADSLISLSPGDSLYRFAEEQKKLAFDKTLLRAKSAKENIRKEAEASGNFLRADSLAEQLILRYREFSEALSLAEWKADIHEIALSQEANGSYWKTHSPEALFEQALAMEKKGDVSSALSIYKRLLSSSIRARAQEAISSLAEKSCKESRKKASALFAKFLSEKREEVRTQLIDEALSSLSSCIENFPNHAEAKKAKKDRELLEKEK